MAEGSEPTLIERLWEGLQDHECAIMPCEKDVTIAWDIWHITRIEDLTVNFLIGGTEQVLSDAWLKRLHTRVTDTGNAMSDDEIMAFSKNVDINALKEYRIAVGDRTISILSKLGAADMKRKIRAEGLEQIRKAGGVLAHPDSAWLLDFWGKKDVAGIILMPVTRHQGMHINDALRLKQVIRRKKAYFRT